MNNSNNQQLLIQKKQELAALEMEYSNIPKPQNSSMLIVIIAILGLILTIGASMIDPFLGILAFGLSVLVCIVTAISSYSKKSKAAKNLGNLSNKILAVKNQIIEIENS